MMINDYGQYGNHVYNKNKYDDFDLTLSKDDENDNEYNNLDIPTLSK